MSFSEDPFKHISITYNHETGFGWECNSCGYESQYSSRKVMMYKGETPIVEIAADFWQHVMESHHYTREDTKDWS